jgi:methylated-DNA-protein-cysteine methyltransferase related protein
MPKSTAFIQMKAGVLEVASKIPVGRITTYGAISEHMNVMARHVAYILTTLTFEEQEELPWHRVVANKGAISASGKLTSRHQFQISTLKEEGIVFTSKNCIDNFDKLFCSPVQLVDWNYQDKQYLNSSSTSVGE